MITAAIISFGLLLMAWLFAPAERPEPAAVAMAEEVVAEAA